ncbi:hypothetical protein J3Q64DRAFT_1704260 [Phycomyces blakesleeanus]|uniref:Uncharacterized protein n=1 Tax=Phycomyces blakesleeanus TaxID=4837 RepID=A0ABR3AHN9_PHYBL
MSREKFMPDVNRKLSRAAHLFLNALEVSDEREIAHVMDKILSVYRDKVSKELQGDLLIEPKPCPELPDAVNACVEIAKDVQRPPPVIATEKHTRLKRKAKDVQTSPPKIPKTKHVPSKDSYKEKQVSVLDQQEDSDSESAKTNYESGDWVFHLTSVKKRFQDEFNGRIHHLKKAETYLGVTTLSLVKELNELDLKDSIRLGRLALTNLINSDNISYALDVAKLVSDGSNIMPNEKSLKKFISFHRAGKVLLKCNQALKSDILLLYPDIMSYDMLMNVNEQEMFCSFGNLS